MVIRGKLTTSRWLKMRRICGYGAALAVTPYLLIKIVWSLGLLLPTEQMGDASWRMINATTAVLAAVGILLAMAFCRPWGEKLPAWLVALPVWAGTGLLIPLLLLTPVLGPAAITRDKQAGAAEFWVYEQLFVMISLVGVGILLPIALAGYVKARWPEALTGPIDYGELHGDNRQLQVKLGKLVAAGSFLLGALKLYWAVGGTIGIDPALLDNRDVWWHLLTLSMGAWSLAGAWSLLMLTTRRGSLGFLLPMAVTWISSGMLFSYNTYDLLTGIHSNARPAPEYPLARVLTMESGIVLGVTMAIIILLVLHDRRRALMNNGMVTGEAESFK
ncbi:hypothetical protein [Fictibacillus fluitans]|uniref:ABC transporter permease n=1 Tax=Fictibacillus fluitans TaxID=3058422 RepID=A0ABT8HYS5_9BACL|nr:hypothetical protein [Fictibacillus sp. NE201]MDN4525912.1 hypothetical protein [Fictibacillus sp. NE201]